MNKSRRPGGKLDAAVQTRVNSQYLATILAWYDTQGRAVGSIAELVREAIEDFALDLVRRRGARPIETVSDAWALLNALGEQERPFHSLFASPPLHTTPPLPPPQPREGEDTTDTRSYEERLAQLPPTTREAFLEGLRAIQHRKEGSDAPHTPSDA